MGNASQSSGLIQRLPPFNWPGLATGLLMLVIPFLGPWLSAEVGTGALRVAFSPFHYEVFFAGQELTSSLVTFLILAAKLTLMIGGALAIAGSVFPKRWWGKKLVEWGGMKIILSVVFFIVIIVLGTFLTNRFLPGIITSLIDADASMQFGLPYLMGTGQATITAENAVTISAPVTISLTPAFWLSVGTVILGIGARIYHGRLLENLNESEE